MARRNKKSETLSQETPKVQETLLEEISDNETPSIVEDSKAGQVEIEKSENKDLEVANTNVMETNTNVMETKTNVMETNKEDLKPGDRVKINKGVTVDTLGRRIHNGIKNYTYKVLNVRGDGYTSIECLTYAFLVRKSDLTKI